MKFFHLSLQFAQVFSRLSWIKIEFSLRILLNWKMHKLVKFLHHHQPSVTNFPHSFPHFPGLVELEMEVEWQQEFHWHCHSEMCKIYWLMACMYNFIFSYKIPLYRWEAEVQSHKMKSWEFKKNLKLLPHVKDFLYSCHRSWKLTCIGSREPTWQFP